MSNEFPIWFTVHTKDRKGRLVYHPDLDQHYPWISYYKGTAGKHFNSIGQAMSNGFRNLETDQDRQERASKLREIGFDIPNLPSVSVKND